MVTAEAIRGNWKKLQKKIPKHWRELKGENLERFEGDAEKLIGEIQLKTGEARENIEDYIEHLTSQSDSTIGQAREKAKQYTSQVASMVASVPSRISETAQAGCEQTEKKVRRHPLRSLTIAYVMGLFTGAFATWWVTSSRKHD